MENRATQLHAMAFRIRQTLSLLPLLLIFKQKKNRKIIVSVWLGGLTAGGCLFLGLLAKQIGLAVHDGRKHGWRLHQHVPCVCANFGTLC